MTQGTETKKVVFGRTDYTGAAPKLYSAYELMRGTPTIEKAMELLALERVDVKPGRGVAYIGFNDADGAVAMAKANTFAEALNDAKKRANDSLPQKERIFESLVEVKGTTVTVNEATLRALVSVMRNNDPEKMLLMDLSAGIDDKAKLSRPVQEPNEGFAAKVGRGRKPDQGHVAAQHTRNLMITDDWVRGA